MKRIPPSERTREAIRTMLAEGSEEARSAQSELVRMATRLIVEEALEAKVADLLGREDYKRGEGAGHRNGHRERSLKTAEGAGLLDTGSRGDRPWREWAVAAVTDCRERAHRGVVGRR